MTPNPNWTALFAARLETIFTPAATVYSNIDPAREFVGVPIVEVQETGSPNFRTFLSGRSEQTRAFTVACRAATAAQSLDFARSARAFLFDVLRTWEQSGAFYAIAFDEIATEPDERGLVTGESFYSYVTFQFTENCGLPQGDITQ